MIDSRTGQWIPNALPNSSLNGNGLALQNNALRYQQIQPQFKGIIGAIGNPSLQNNSANGQPTRADSRGGPGIPHQMPQMNNSGNAITPPTNFRQLPTPIPVQTPNQSGPNDPGFYQPNWNPQGFYPQFMPGQSVEQRVNNASPQSVQNFLSALNQAGAGSNNNFQNQSGAQGQQAQAGFQGFNGNGYQMQPQNYGNFNGNYGNPYQVNYQQPGYQENIGVGYAGNQAYQGGYGNWQGGAPEATSYGILHAGNYGSVGKPQYQTQTPGWNSNIPTNYNYFSDPNGHGGWAGYDQEKNRQADYSAGPKAPSDIASKEEIEPGSKELEDFLNSLGVYSYEYKNKEYGEGRRISPMAQEIESTPLGKAAISLNKDGYKMVDYGKLSGTMLASLALHHRRINDLEDELKEAIVNRVKSKRK